MFRSLAVPALLALGVAAKALGLQVVLDSGAASIGALSLNGTRSTQSLASVTSYDEFVSLTHSRYPSHRVRVKKSDFCDPTVK